MKLKVDIPKEDRTGYRTWKNKENGFTVVELHYSADPAKRAPEWKREESRGMPVSKWDREYELSWETSGGRAVYGKSFNRQYHVSQKELPHVPGITLFRGWDFGLNQCCGVVQLVGRQARILKEYVTEGQASIVAIPAILQSFSQDFGEDTHVIDIVDPAGFNREQATGSTCISIMEKFGLQPEPGIQDPEIRINSVSSYLNTMYDGEPALLVNPSCKLLIGGFLGGYSYKKIVNGSSTRFAEKPEKNEYSHIHDGIQYVFTKIEEFRGRMSRGYQNVDIPTPSYDFDV